MLQNPLTKYKTEELQILRELILWQKIRAKKSRACAVVVVLFGLIDAVVSEASHPLLISSFHLNSCSWVVSLCLMMASQDGRYIREGHERG